MAAHFTLTNINDLLDLYVQNNLAIKRYAFGVTPDIEDMIARKQTFPCLYGYIESITTPSDIQKQYTLKILIFDLLSNDKNNEIPVWSACVEHCEDLEKFLKYNAQNYYDVQPSRIEVFTEKYTEFAAGAMMTLTFLVDYEQNDCGIMEEGFDFSMPSFLASAGTSSNFDCDSLPNCPTIININNDIAYLFANSGVTGNFLSLSGGTVSGNTNFSNGAILSSGGTDLYNIFLSNDSQQDAVIRVRVATTQPMGTSNYNNGVGGVGATLTKFNNGVLPTVDGITLSVGDRILIKNPSSAIVGGIWEVTDSGSTTSPWILTRTTDGDESLELNSAIVSPSEGVVNAGLFFAQTTPDPIIGTDLIVWIQTTNQAFVTQSLSGQQNIGNIPFWNNTFRQLSRGTTGFKYDSTRNILFAPGIQASVGFTGGTLMLTAVTVDNTLTTLLGRDATGKVYETYISGITSGATGAPALPFTSVQFNDSGVFGGTADFTYDKLTGSLISGSGSTIDSATLFGSIIGGTLNSISGASDGSSILGGSLNSISGASTVSTIIGSYKSSIGDNSQLSLIAGGGYNNITGNSVGSSIISSFNSTIEYLSDLSHINGGQGHILSGNTKRSAIIGGKQSYILASSNDTAIIGGMYNLIYNAGHSAIVGSVYNEIGNSLVTSIASSVGVIITGSSFVSSVIGGYNSMISGSSGSAMLGGRGQRLYNTLYSATIGGSGNTISDSKAVVINGGAYHNVSNRSDGSGIIGGSLGTVTDHSYDSIMIGGYSNVLSSSTKSAIIGGSGLTLNNEHQKVLVPQLKIWSATTDNSLITFLGRDTDGNVHERDISGLITGGTGTPGLPYTSVQFNDGGVFGGSSEFTFDKTTLNLSHGTGNTFTNSVLNANIAGINNTFTNVTATTIDTSTSSSLSNTYVSSIIASSGVAIAGGGASVVIGSISGSTTGSRATSSISTIGAIVTNSNFSSNIAGAVNQIESSSYSTTVGGSVNRVLSAISSTIIGGAGNIITSSSSSAIVGGKIQTITSSPYSSFVGGRTGTINTSSGVGAMNSNVVAINSNSSYSSVVANTNGTITNSVQSLVAGGGPSRVINQDSAAIVAGKDNLITSASLQPNIGDVIIGSKNGIVSNSFYSSLISGKDNGISGSTRSAIIGGSGLTLSNVTDTVYVPQLRIAAATTDNTLTTLLGRDVSGNVHEIGIGAISGVTVGSTQVQNGLNTYTGGTVNFPTVNISAATLTSLYSTTLSGGTLYSGSTNLYSIFSTSDTNDVTRVQPGLNIYTGGTGNNPTINISAATLTSLSATTISGETLFSGSTNLYSIFSTTDTNDITRVQPGLNIYTGGTGNAPTINMSAATLFSLSATTLSGGTIYSGGTNLYDIFTTQSGLNTFVQPGLNTYTGGSANFPTVNISAATLVRLSATTLSGGTIYSGSTNLYQIFGGKNDFWSLTGNTGTTTANFIGTRDDADFNFKRNNIQAGIIGVTSTGIGYRALQGNTASAVTAFGQYALYGNAGNNVVGIGRSAGNNNTGWYSNHIGRSAGGSNSGTYAVSIGDVSNVGNTGNNVVGIGLAAGFNNKGDVVVAIGAAAARFNSGTSVVGIGQLAASKSRGTQVIGIGMNAAYNNAGRYVVGIGYRAAQGNKGYQSVGIGWSALSGNTKGEFVAIGSYAGFRNSGDTGVALGYGALNSNTGDNAIAAGWRAGKNNSGSNIIALGREAGENNTFSNSVMIGHGANASSANQFAIAPTITTVVFSGATLMQAPLAAYADDTAAGVAGLTTGQWYQTTGAALPPLNVAGIVMIKQ